MHLFVTGVSGLFGVNFALQARRHYRVSGSYFSHQVHIDETDTVRADLTRTESIDELIAAYSPDVIVHAAGLTSVDGCERQPELAQQLNVEMAADVARAAGRAGIGLVHLSSDHIFDGRKSWHSEEDQPFPLNTYARTKLNAELRVREAHPAPLIIRTNFYGWGTSTRPSFSDWILAALTRGDELRMFADVYFTPILLNDLIDIVLDLLNRNVAGLMHVAGAERLTKYRFAQRAAAVFEILEPDIRPVSVQDAGLVAPRPRDMSLRTEAVASVLGRPMPSADDGLRRLRTLRDEGWPIRVRSALLPEGSRAR